MILLLHTIKLLLELTHNDTSNLDDNPITDETCLIETSYDRNSLAYLPSRSYIA